MVDADASQRSDHDLALRREAQPGNLVIRKRVTVRFGMKEADRFSRGDIHPVQPLQRADPHFVAGAQIRGRLVVFSDVDPRQDSGQGQPLALDVPDFEEMSAEGDPGGSVSFDIVDPGHETCVCDLALQGIDLAAVSRPGEGYSVQDIVRNEPQASVGVPVHVSRRVRTPPRPGHPGDVVDEFRIRLRRELDEGIAIVADQPSAEGADPGVALAVKIDSVDILVRQSALPGQPVDNEVVFRSRLRRKPSGKQEQA